MITLIIGGTRSGKSAHALNLASGESGKAKAYVATAQALDEEMTERINRHKDERSEDWITFEEPFGLAALLREVCSHFDQILVDCLTVWLSNKLLNEPELVDGAIEGLVQALMETQRKTQYFIVTNEVGMGIVPDNALARTFRDLAGLLNQKVAEVADHVYLVSAGIPIKIK
ncbi:MAG TPA: bifunctional adenosylcobinamide kinase/adenosylcobinamide-phosphate guanylyltransferase [Dissulfurispiraceae bacterium]|nr:bifunctional adenosylcobinamide kinase/adenosylcobinamide-phosphate guanylyltransferase [Dissulfurispiraceae bacterium]